MLRCNKCDEPISEPRIRAFLTSTGKLPTYCTKCAPNHNRKAVISMAGGKTGCEIVVYDSDNHEMERQADRYRRRAR